MITTSKYGKPNLKKISIPSGREAGGNNEIDSITIAGTEVTDASAAMTA
jgi:hypothetical protein